MSKTINLQIAKSRRLIDGLRSNPDVMTRLNISDSELSAMSNMLEELAVMGRECDELRGKMSVKVKQSNELLAKIKDEFATKKKLVKVNYPQEEWLRYGVEDKR